MTDPSDRGLIEPIKKFEDTFSGETAIMDWLKTVSWLRQRAEETRQRWRDHAEANKPG